MAFTVEKMLPEHLEGLGAVLGAAIMGVLRQGLVLLEVETFWQKFVERAVIIGAVALDMIRRYRGKH